MSNEPKPQTISSLEISRLTEKRHDNVKRMVVKVCNKGGFLVPPLESETFLDSMGRTQTTTSYRLDRFLSMPVVAWLDVALVGSLSEWWDERRPPPHIPRLSSMEIAHAVGKAHTPMFISSLNEMVSSMRALNLTFAPPLPIEPFGWMYDARVSPYFGAIWGAKKSAADLKGLKALVLKTEANSRVDGDHWQATIERLP
jgi:hypothetical protein